MSSSSVMLTDPRSSLGLPIDRSRSYKCAIVDTFRIGFAPAAALVTRDVCLAVASGTVTGSYKIMKTKESGIER